MSYTTKFPEELYVGERDVANITHQPRAAVVEHGTIYVRHDLIRDFTNYCNFDTIDDARIVARLTKKRLDCVVDGERFIVYPGGKTIAMKGAW